MKPVRIQLKRTKGYNMQAVSLALNGLPAVKVTRPGPYGNPYKVTSWRTATFAIMCYEVALLEVKIFGEAIPPKPWAYRIIADLDELRDKNLACWCPLEDKNGGTILCHADFLLKLANN